MYKLKLVIYSLIVYFLLIWIQMLFLPLQIGFSWQMMALLILFMVVESLFLLKWSNRWTQLLMSSFVLMLESQWVMDTVDIFTILCLFLTNFFVSFMIIASLKEKSLL